MVLPYTEIEDEDGNIEGVGVAYDREKKFCLITNGHPGKMRSPTEYEKPQLEEFVGGKIVNTESENE